MKLNKLLIIICVFINVSISNAQYSSTHWANDGKSYYEFKNGALVKSNLLTKDYEIVITSDKLKYNGNSLEIDNYSFSPDEKKLVLFANTSKVWRYNTKGDYYVYDLKAQKLQRVGASMPESSTMFAKLSPDGSQIAYVSNRNIYVEDLKTQKIKALTKTDGNPKLINGTFDWAYEEEFSIYDGFRWSPDSKQIAYWQLDASGIKYFNMINNTNDIYAQVIPLEYPKVGEDPSSCRIGVVDIKSAKTKWMDVPGDNKQHYIPRMEWAESGTIMLQQLDRKQQVSKLFYADSKTGATIKIYEESEPNAWVDVRTTWHEDQPAGWEWIKGGKEFLWVSEKDGYNHVYKISKDGKSETLVTKGNYDVVDPLGYDQDADILYFTASPVDSRQLYLYQISVKNPGQAVRITPLNQEGTHGYTLSENKKFALHRFSNYYTPNSTEWISLPDHKPLDPTKAIDTKIDPGKKAASNVKMVEITTASGVAMEGWMALPKNFDPNKKYATVFYVYGEPASMTSKDTWSAGKNNLYVGNMAEDGYIYISIDGRGSPAPKGAAWRKAIYRNIGIVNIKDQAEGAMALFAKYPFIDQERIAVHGWSGGGSSTLNLLFKYPKIYRTGISVAAVANQLTYDNIYQERYMGVPPGDLNGFIEGSPITHAKNLEGNLLYIHGTGDDNVHYQNAEMLVNELIKYNKQFQFMAYPNRAHGIYEGEGTRKHLNTLFTKYLKEHCPPGGR